MIYAGILAAGIGTRMHRQDVPKQFLTLGEKPIVIHTIEQFFINPRVEKIIVVTLDDWKQYTEDLLARCDTMGKKCYAITGGANKSESIGMLTHYIEQSWGIAHEDILIAHDAIRPFLTQRIIDDNIDAAQKYGAANTAIMTNDALLISRDGKRLNEVPPHEHIYAEQTPQTYSLTKLKKVVERSGVTLKNESELPRLYIKAGNEMYLVSGEYFNMKIVNPYDLEVANALLRERKV